MAIKPIFVPFSILLVVFVRYQITDAVTTSSTTPAPRPVLCGRPFFSPFERHPGAKSGIVRPNSWPWQASIRFRSRHRCSGVLISKHYVLTSAQCFSALSLDPADYEVWLGKHHRDELEIGQDQQLAVEQIILHPDYAVRSIYDADLAIVRLESYGAWVRNNYTQPICLEPPLIGSQKGNKIPDNCYVTGYGRLNKQRPTALELKQAQVPIISNERCARQSRVIKPHLTSNALCGDASENQLSSCETADPGSPLVCKSNTTSSWWLQGVVSSGMECMKPPTPVVYVRVANYLKWIKATATDLVNVVAPQ